jgi:hypothetical protein
MSRWTLDLAATHHGKVLFGSKFHNIVISRKEVLPSMSVMYCASFNQNLYRGFKEKRSFKQALTTGAKVTTGEETRQLAPESSSNQVQNCLNAVALTATFLKVSGGSS